MYDHSVRLLEDRIISAAVERGCEVGRPVVVALDGRIASGKSTIAGRLDSRSDVVRVPLDDFYQTAIAEADLNRFSAAEKLDFVFDWTRVRSDALEPLRASRPGRWHAFDFTSGLTEAGTYQLSLVATEVQPAPIILLDGAYSASAPLSDLIDIAVLVDAPSSVRHARALARGDSPEFLSVWHQIWDEVEVYYFDHVRPPSSFDIVLSRE